MMSTYNNTWATIISRLTRLMPWAAVTKLIRAAPGIMSDLRGAVVWGFPPSHSLILLIFYSSIAPRRVLWFGMQPIAPCGLRDTSCPCSIKAAARQSAGKPPHTNPADVGVKRKHLQSWNVILSQSWETWLCWVIDFWSGSDASPSPSLYLECVDTRSAGCNGRTGCFSLDIVMRRTRSSSNLHHYRSV